jgi:glycyl-tRNA synthetase beta chain
MSELLLELFSEEIPARLQPRASGDLCALVCAGLTARGLPFGEARAFATPRRLALVIADVADASPAVSHERKGPRVGAPEAAVTGFLKAAGLSSLDQATIVKDEKKGDYYIARIDKPGRPAAEIIAETVAEVVAKFPWPKTQRWGAGDLAWIRPLRSILCLLGGKVLRFEIGGIASSDTTRGHRFHGNAPFAVACFDDYVAKLRANRVILDPDERRRVIAEQAQTMAKAAKMTLTPDEGLLAENAGLTEWPTVMMGTFEDSFLAVPGECLATAMKQHQKCFALHQTGKAEGKLANRFLLVSNLIADDGGTQIVAGNEKVIRARLSDAKFFYEQDLKRSLAAMAHELGAITFHEKLGTQAERVERITELARRIAGAVDAEPELAGRAAQLCKADLVSGMVGEFPELQGLMGRYYAEAAHMDGHIARAIEEHYKPKGAGDTVPNEPVSVAVALADKIDTLVGFWAIGEKPTGSGDPFQLRRAALGVIRIVLENDERLPLLPVFAAARALHNVGGCAGALEQTDADLLTFFHDRLKVYLRDKGARHDLIDAVLAAPGAAADDLALVVKRVDALSDLLATDDGANLLAGVKRASNILGIEEKKDKTTYTGAADAALLTLAEEKALHAAVTKVANDTRKAIDVERFDGAMRALAELRAPVDAFFDAVTVNAEDKAVRRNRLALLSQIRSATLAVADFSRIAG